MCYDPLLIFGTVINPELFGHSAVQSLAIFGGKMFGAGHRRAVCLFGFCIDGVGLQKVRVIGLDDTGAGIDKEAAAKLAVGVEHAQKYLACVGKVERVLSIRMRGPNPVKITVKRHKNWAIVRDTARADRCNRHDGNIFEHTFDLLDAFLFFLWKHAFTIAFRRSSKNNQRVGEFTAGLCETLVLHGLQAASAST